MNISTAASPTVIRNITHMIETHLVIKSFFESWTVTAKPTSEDNFFSIGTRGFYENPFTEILSYIFKAGNKYSQRADFIRLLLKNVVGKEIIESLISQSEVKTQHSTISGKYIDLIIHNSKYVITFENKIFHWLANPFEEYENDIKMRFPTQESHFILLSYKQEIPPINWKNIIIQNAFKNIANDIVHNFDNKWDFFVYDFLIHFSKKENIIMNEEENKFYEQNFSKIISANKNLTDYILSIGENIKSKSSIRRYSFIPNWGELSKSLRFYPFETNDNVTLVFNENSKFTIAIYYYKNYLNNVNELSQIVGPEYKNWHEGKSSICCFTQMAGKEFIELDKAIDECLLQIEKMINTSANIGIANSEA